MTYETRFKVGDTVYLLAASSPAIIKDTVKEIRILVQGDDGQIIRVFYTLKDRFYEVLEWNLFGTPEEAVERLKNAIKFLEE